MPAFSGLWDGVHGEAYNAMTKSDARPPVLRGIVRALMQGRTMHGHVTALGRNAPSVVARIPGSLTSEDVRGTFDYAKWKADPNDATRFVIDYTMTDHGRILVNDGTGSGQPMGSQPRVANATEADMAHTYDTTLRNGYAGDEAGSGSTGTAQSEVISDGS